MNTPGISLIPHGGSIPIARMRSVYKLADVGQKLDKLPSKEHEGLRATYERMLEKGPDRFQVKPAGIPSMEHLYEELPNFIEVLNHVRRSVALVHDSPDDSLAIPPMLLLGPPGIGKTHFAREISNLLGTGMGFVSMSSLTAGWVLSGASSQWKGARPGKVFETLVDGQYANPVMVIDEIDKAGGEHAYDPLGALYGLLEHDTAGSFMDEFAEVPIDASQVIWVATANDERSIPDPIRNRMETFEVREPTLEEAMKIGKRLYSSIRLSHHWGEQFEEDLDDEILSILSTIVPRDMRKVLMTAFGNAKIARRGKLQGNDFPGQSTSKGKIGFVQ